MKFSASTAFIVLLAAAEAGPVVRVRDDEALASRSIVKSLANVLLPRKKEKEALAEDPAGALVAGDPAASLEAASLAMQQATAALDQAIADLGAAPAPATDAKAPATDAQDGGAEAAPADGAAPALVKGPGGAVTAVTAEGLLLPDGRIAADIVSADFDKETSVFQSGNVKGDGVLFADIISFPDTTPSLFDSAAGTKAFAININDKSIFVPGGAGGTPQEQFRRTDMLPSSASVADNSSVTGIRTVHFSVQQEVKKPLALTTNEYQLSFLETADFASRTYDVRVGTGTTGPSLDGTNIVVFGRSGDAIQEMFVAPFSEELQNFAVTLDFDANTMQVFHSVGQTPLAAVTEVVANDNSGQGEYHFALLKLADAAGEQAAGIDESIIYSGIFMEDSSDGSVTLE